jgi:GNAT superfamily N-acetyltransferase
VRIAASRRGQGIGHVMIEWAIAECRKRGCGLVQLTMNKSREDTLRFYKSLGFEATHEGFKLTL